MKYIIKFIFYIESDYIGPSVFSESCVHKEQ